MTERQIEAYRQRLAGATSQAERDRLVYQHYQDMQKRAKNLGVVLPYTAPPAAPVGLAPPNETPQPAGPRLTGNAAQGFAPPPLVRDQFGQGFSEVPGFRVRTGIGVDPGRPMNSWNGYPPQGTLGPGSGYQPFTSPKPPTAATPSGR